MEEGEAKIDSFHHSVKCNKIIMCNAQSILIKSNYTCISVYIQIHPCISHRYLCIYKQMFKKYMHELVYTSHTNCTVITGGDRESDVAANRSIKYNYLYLHLPSSLTSCVVHWLETKDKN